MKETKIYLPGLNGIRAFAALAVVVSHTTLALSEFGLNDKVFGVDKFGNPLGLLLAGHSVTIFFVLSGFLITYLTIVEKEKAGRLNIKKFYVRRLLRIWPLYYLYLLIALLLIVLLNLDTSNFGQIPFYIFLAANIPFIFGKGLPLLAHYWSLGVEEQFYLFFPQIARVNLKKIFVVFITLGLLLWILKVTFWYLQSTSEIYKTLYQILFVTRFYSMFLGGAAAILFYKGNTIFFRFFTNRITQIIAWSMVFLLVINKFNIASVIDSEFVALMALALIIGQITKNGVIDLENKVMDFLGKISYGIYVIHPIIILGIEKLLPVLENIWYNYIIVYVLIITLTILISDISYRYFETKFLKLKTKYAVIKSSNTRK